METSATTMSKEHNSVVHSAQKPQYRIDEINPDCILLALNTRVSIGILIDVDLAKHAKDSNPENTTNMSAIESN